MGQAANSGRNASLDEKKRRAAGRSTGSKILNPLRDDALEVPAKGQTGGAFGSAGRSGPTGGGGQDDTLNALGALGVGPSTRRTRKRR
jgi:hypothetical protein